MKIYYSLKSQERVVSAEDFTPVSTTDKLILSYGKLEHFDLEMKECPEDFFLTVSDIVCWDVIVYGLDGGGLLCHTVDSEIDSSKIKEGRMVFPVATRTANFLAAVEKSDVHGWLEIRGFNSDGSLIYSMKFRTIARYSNDPSNQPPVEILEDIATMSWVKKMLSGENAESYVTKEMLNSALSCMPIIESGSPVIKLGNESVVKHTITDGDIITFDTTSLGSDQCITMELWLRMPGEVVSFTMSDVTWIEEPSFDTANTLYAVVVKWDGEKIIGNMAYSLPSAAV